MSDLKLTRVQRAILDVLSDGMRHHVSELLSVSPSGSKSLVQKQVCLLRPIMRRHGHDIVCEYYHRRWYYRHVRLLCSSDE